MHHAFQSWIVPRYSLRFGSTNATVQSARFHVRLRNVGWSEKGMSLEVSQGMPRSEEMQSMSLML